jgi:hypothetical protein
MPIKKDDTGKRWVEMEFITPGTPEHRDAPGRLRTRYCDGRYIPRG